MNKLFFITLLLFTIISCSKNIEGKGGNSSIRGKITGINVSQGKKEIFSILFPPGEQIEHGDYWIFNGVIEGERYYVYYTNPSWISPSDPQLNGRIGIEVVFNYNDQNTVIAEKTFQALNASNLFNFEIILSGDFITVKNKNTGYVVDADDLTSKVSIDILEQGEPDIIENEKPMVNERVYLIYGNDKFYSETTRTNADGEFSFDGYKKGNYEVFVSSENKVTGEVKDITKEISILKNKTIVECGTLTKYY